MGFGWVVAVLLAVGCGSGGSAFHPLPNGNYQVADESVYFEVASAGARVLDVHLPGGANLLTGPSTDAAQLRVDLLDQPAEPVAVAAARLVRQRGVRGDRQRRQTCRSRGR